MSWVKKNGRLILTVALVTVVAVIAFRVFLGVFVVIALLVLAALAASITMGQRWTYQPSTEIKKEPKGRYEIEEEQEA